MSTKNIKAVKLISSSGHLRGSEKIKCLPEYNGTAFNKNAT
jgi:hypothetical protein